MPKVLLINPPQRYFIGAMDFDTYVPLGLMSIAAVARGNCEVKILDCLVTEFEAKESQDFILYGTPPAEIEKVIQNYRPDIVGISVPFSAQLQSAIDVSRICKKVDPNIVVLFGGPDASVRYKEHLEAGYCDYCVVGEGERTFFEFVKASPSKDTLKNVEGVAYKLDDKVVYKPRGFIEQLDALPFPAYDLTDMNLYLKNKYLYLNRTPIHKNSITIITSRGCPFGCTFCSVKLHMGQKFRAHSPNYVIKHLKLLKEQYGITNFHFEDDNLLFDKPRFHQILDKIIEEKLHIRWDTPNGVHVNSLSFELLKKMKNTGCVSLTISIESGNQRVLSTVIKKPVTLDHTIEIVKHCRSLGIRLIAFYVIGFPGETIADAEETTELALRLFRVYNVSPRLLVATPLYGTELYKECLKKGFIRQDLTDRDFAVGTQIYGEPLISTGDFSKEDIKNIIYRYNQALKKEMMAYAMRNPIYALRKVIEKPENLKKVFKLGFINRT